MTPPRIGLIRRLALVEGVRQIVERHRRRQIEQIHRRPEQMRLDHFAVTHQRIGGPVQLHRPHGLEVHLKQLPQRTALPKPGCVARSGAGYASRAMIEPSAAVRKAD